MDLRLRVSATARMLACAFMVLVFSGCRAPERASAAAFSVEDWTGEGLVGRRYHTDHFEIISTLRDREFETALPAFCEAAHARYVQTISFPQARAKLVTHIFADRAQWSAFTRRRFPERFDVYSRIRHGGFTEGNASAIFYVDRATALATIAHEGWHQYVNAHVEEPLPAWINEGLGSYHEAIEYSSDEPRFTPLRNTFRINALIDALKRDRLLAVRELVETDAGRVLIAGDDEATHAYYAQTWALITLLRHGANGKFAAAFQRMMDDIAAGTFHARLSALRVARQREATSDDSGKSGDGNVNRVRNPSGVDGLPGASQAPPPFVESDGGLALIAYFDHTPEALQEVYYDHVVRVTGLVR